MFRSGTKKIKREKIIGKINGPERNAVWSGPERPGAALRLVVICCRLDDWKQLKFASSSFSPEIVNLFFSLSRILSTRKKRFSTCSCVRDNRVKIIIISQKKVRFTCALNSSVQSGPTDLSARQIQILFFWKTNTKKTIFVVVRRKKLLTKWLVITRLANGSCPSCWPSWWHCWPSRRLVRHPAAISATVKWNRRPSFRRSRPTRIVARPVSSESNLIS